MNQSVSQTVVCISYVLNVDSEIKTVPHLCVFIMLTNALSICTRSAFLPTEFAADNFRPPSLSQMTINSSSSLDNMSILHINNMATSWIYHCGLLQCNHLCESRRITRKLIEACDIIKTNSRLY